MLQMPPASANSNPNIQQTLSSLRSTITKKIPFRRGRSGVQSAAGAGGLPSPDTIDRDNRSLSTDTYENPQQMAENSVIDQHSRAAAAAILLGSSASSRYVETEFRAHSSGTSSAPTPSLSSIDGEIHRAEQQSDGLAASPTQRTHRSSRSRRTQKTVSASEVNGSIAMSNTGEETSDNEDSSSSVHLVSWHCMIQIAV